MSGTVEFLGEQFAVAERIGLMPLMRFAKHAKSGVDSESMAGLAAMYDLLEQCIAPSDWQRFEDHADRERADGEQLLGVVTAVIEALSARPSTRPSDSSAGPSTTAPNSTDDSSSVVQRLEDKGRPDLALMVDRAVKARASA